MAAVAELRKVRVLVYEQVGKFGHNFKRIGAFGAANAKAVRVVYQVRLARRLLASSPGTEDVGFDATAGGGAASARSFLSSMRS